MFKLPGTGRERHFGIRKIDVMLHMVKLTTDADTVFCCTDSFFFGFRNKTHVHMCRTTCVK
jgi:hypothetical protein